MGVVRIDQFMFKNGKKLTFPVFDSRNIAYNVTISADNWRNGFFFAAATKYVGDNNYSIDIHGLPLHRENAWEDYAGNLWYYEINDYPQNPDFYWTITLNYGGRSENFNLPKKANNTNSDFLCFTRHIFRMSWETVLEFGVQGSFAYAADWNGFERNNQNVRYHWSSRGSRGTSVNWILTNARQMMTLPNPFRVDIYSTNRGSGSASLTGTTFGAQISAYGEGYTTDVDPAKGTIDTNDDGGISRKYVEGRGNFDRTSDTIAVPSLPTLSATKTGFVTLYKPSLSQIVQVCEYLWGSVILNMLKNLLMNPMDLIIGLGIVPVSAPASTTSAPGVAEITVPVIMYQYDSQYYEYDCGTLKIEEFWGTAFDYAPFTQIQIYLPYVGVRELNVDEVMGQTIGVKYHIDLFGGGLMAYVTVNGSIRYQFSGNCMQQIPVNAANFDNLLQNLVNVACVVGSGIAASGAGAAASDAAAIASRDAAGIARLDYGMSAGAANAFGDVVGAYQGAKAGMAAMSEWESSHGMQLMGCTLDTVINSKPRIERTGSMASTTGQLSVQTPYLIISRAEQCLPDGYKHYRGYPSNITARLGDLDGYTEVEDIRINDLDATQPELVEIYQLLKKGVII